MTAIGDYSDVLNDNMIAAWPRVAAALEGLDCALMGGTAVAMVLRHRHSHDLDFMTLQPFDSRAVAAKLLSSAARAAYKDDDRPHIAKVAFDGVPVTVMRDLRGFVEGHATQLADPSVVDGIAVGSVPDLMATKLDVIQHRRQGRDYIDIAAMDRAGACTIEDGLRYHKQRYAPTVTYEETLRIAQLATSPPPTDPDPAFDRHLARGCQPPHRTPARRPRLGTPVRATATPTATRTPRTRILIRPHGHAEGGRVVPQLTAQASAHSITNRVSRSSPICLRSRRQFRYRGPRRPNRTVRSSR